MPLDPQIEGSREATRRLEKELRPGEQLLWSGKPRPGFRVGWSDLPPTLGMTLAVLFAVIWTTDAAGSGPWPFVAIGLAFVALTLHGLVGRHLVDMWKRGRTFYGVTNDRLVVVTEYWSRQAQSQQLVTLSNLALDRCSDASGMISVGPWTWSSGFGYPRPAPDMAFEQLPDCAAVFNLIVKAREAATERGPG